MQFSSSKMDELLIAEVQKHEVIYNRQKYFLMNHTGPEKYGSKDDAWNYIAITLGSDVDTCKKRWKYLRERYVQQRKQGDTPTYEHLSRPYLEKMKFLDQHIQPRKSYRNVSQFLPSPNANAPFGDYPDSSRSNGSMKNGNFLSYPENMMPFKSEPETFQNFSPVNSVQSQSQQQSSPTHFQQDQQQSHQPRSPNEQQQNISRKYTPPQNDYRDQDVYNIPSSSSSMQSPSVPDQQSETNHMPKRQRLDNHNSSSMPNSTHNQTINQNINDDTSDNDEPPSNHVGNDARHQRPPFPNELFYSLFQQYNNQRPATHSTEQLIGDLVTAELLQMSKERRKIVQRKILEILFFDD